MTNPRSSTADLDTLQLHIGARLQVSLTRDIKNAKKFTTLIGYSRNDYVILKMPSNDGGNQIRENDTLTVQAFSGVKVCSFTTVVMRVFDAPVNYLHVAYPPSVQITELRSAVRVKTDLEARLLGSSAGREPAGTVRIRNLSSAGALIESPATLAGVGETVRFAVMLPDLQTGEDVSLHLDAEICKNDLQTASDNTALAGVRFVGLDRTTYLTLQNYVYATLINNRQSII